MLSSRRGAPRRAPFALVTTAVLAMGTALPAAAGAATAGTTQVVTYDVELAEALVAHDLLGAWYDAAPVEPELALVNVAAAGLTPARETFFAAIAEKADLEARVAGLETHLSERRSHLAIVVAAIPDRAAQLATHRLELSSVTVAEETTTVRLDNLEAALRDAAVASYVGGGVEATAVDGDIDAYNEAMTTAELMEAGTSALLEQRATMLEALERLGAERAAIDHAVAEVTAQLELLELDERRTRADIEIAVAARLSFAARVVELATELPGYLTALHEERMTGVLPLVGLPFALVNAYVRGARIGREVRPGCQLPWPILAGIAAVESGHGTFGGAVVQPDGTVVPGIFGPRLDGTLEGNAVITDTDGGRLDGDPLFDRAVGPFQFIPATWTTFAVDASGDEVADPQNVTDAGATAGNYLCAVSAMGSDEEIQRGIFGYNHSLAYVANVLSRAAPFFAMHLGEVPPEYAPPPETLAFTDEG